LTRSTDPQARGFHVGAEGIWERAGIFVNPFKIAVALRAAVASVVSDQIRRPSKRKCGARSERLENRTYLSYIDYDQSSIPEYMAEGMQVNLVEHWVTSGNDWATAYVNGESYSIAPGDDWVYSADSFDDNTAIDVSIVDAWGGVDGLILYVDNLQPSAEPVSDVQSDGTVLVSLNNPTDPSPVDTYAGFTYSFGYTYADLGQQYTSASSYVFDPSLDVDGVVFGRIQDKDGGYSDYRLTIADVDPRPIPTVNFLFDTAT
jgi:hypothetical protein